MSLRPYLVAACLAIVLAVNGYLLYKERILDPEVRERHIVQRADPLAGLTSVVEAVSIPVGAVTFNTEMGVRAVHSGASFVVQGEPLVSAADGLEQLSRFIESVRSAHRET